MFASVEKYKTPAQILLGLISLTFVGFGVSSFATPGSDYIVKIGDQEINERALNQAVQNAQASGANESKNAVFNRLVQRAYLTSGANKMGITVSDEQIKQIIVDDQSFHDASGKFDQNLFNQYLSQRHIAEDQFVKEIREQFSLQNLLNLVQNGALVSDAQASQLVGLMQSERTVRTFTFSPENFAQKVKITDAALKSYYDGHKKDFVIPQAVKLEYVALKLDDLATKQKVSEDELKQAFDQQSKTAQPKREIAHIFFPVAQNAAADARSQSKAEAEKVLAEVKAHPSDFAALAKKYSKDPASAQRGGDLGYVPKDGGLGKEFEDVAFSLKKGEISGVVQSKFGYHIITVLNIQDKPVFEQEKPRLEAELKRKKAQADFSKAKEKLSQEAFNHSNGLTEVAQATGLKVEAPAEWLTKENGKAAGMPDNLLKVVFSDDVMKKKRNSEPVDVSESMVWVVHAKDVRPETNQTFEQAKEQVRLNYIRDEAAKLAQDEAKKSLADLQHGTKVDLNWSPVANMTADQARQSMPPQAYAQLMKARPVNGKSAYVLLEGLPAPVLIEVQAVKAPANAKEQLPQAKTLLGQTQANGIFDDLLAYLQRTIKQKAGVQKVGD